MLAVALIEICLLSYLGGKSVAQTGESAANGPQVKAFLELMRAEEEELEFQIRNGEITRREYLRSKNRIAVQRQTVLRIVKRTGEDRVPELHVVVASEVDQLIEGGMRLVKAARPGTVIGGRWRYLGPVTRGEVFYIFERLSKSASNIDWHRTSETQ
jgi:hypothetical protein